MHFNAIALYLIQYVPLQSMSCKNPNNYAKLCWCLKRELIQVWVYRWVWKKFLLHPGTSCWVWKRKTAEGCFWLKWIKYNCKINLIQVYYCELQDNICMGANFLQELLLCIMVLNTIVIHGNYDIDSKNCKGNDGKKSLFWKREH